MIRNKLGQFIKGSMIGANNIRWNGGKTIDKYGYIKILKPNFPMSDSKGYVYEHRFKMSEHLGRLLTRQEVVHHINGDIKDNRLTNLKLTVHFNHKSLHGKGRYFSVNTRQKMSIARTKWWATYKANSSFPNPSLSPQLKLLNKSSND